MLSLVKFEINELMERKSILGTCFASEILIILSMFLLPVSALLTIIIIISSIVLGSILYANEMTKTYGVTPGIDKRKLLLSLPITRMEFAVRSIMLYTGYILAQAAFVTIAVLVASLSNPTIIQILPDLILGVLISGGTIVGIMFVGAPINVGGVLQIIIRILLIVALFFYLGYLAGYTSSAGNLPNIWVCFVSLVLYTVGVLIELVVIPRVD